MNQTSSSIGLPGLLALVFITLKLVGVAPVATWSWWWVLSPLWIPVVIFLGFLAIVAIFTALRR